MDQLWPWFSLGPSSSQQEWKKELSLFLKKRQSLREKQEWQEVRLSPLFLSRSPPSSLVPFPLVQGETLGLVLFLQVVCGSRSSDADQRMILKKCDQRKAFQVQQVSQDQQASQGPLASQGNEEQRR